MPYVGQTITEVFPTSISVDSATISGNTTIGGTLGVTGASTLSGTLGVTGVSTLSDNIVFGASGKGVHLGVTSATASNLVDDYEEGTFTARLYGATSGTGTNVTTTASYIKVGKQVTIGGYFQNVDLSSMSGSTQINGLPFTSNAEASNFATGAFALYGFTFTGIVTPYLGSNGTNIDILDSRSNSSWIGLAIPQASGKYMIFSMTYKTA